MAPQISGKDPNRREWGLNFPIVAPQINGGKIWKTLQKLQKDPSRVLFRIRKRGKVFST